MTNSGPLPTTAAILAPALRPAARRIGYPLAALTRWIDQRPTPAFAALSLFYLAVVACLSHVKLLWLDELITLHIARLGSPHAIWQALAAGADPNPPLTHLLVMFCRQLFGEHAFALRLPSIAGYWIGMAALFLFFKQRVPPTWALAGTLLSMGMGAFDWSFESRSYALFYGFAMLALLCWTGAVKPQITPLRRITALAALSLTLAAGLCANYFAVLAFFPIAAAELTRTALRARRTQSPLHAIDWPIWTSLALAATPLLLFRHLIQHSIALYAPYAWNKVSLAGAVFGYIDILEAARYPLFALLFVALTLEAVARFSPAARARLHPRWLSTLATPTLATPTALLTLPEAAAVSAFVAYPFLGFLLAALRGGMFSPRFVLPVCFGFAITATLLAFRLFGPLRHAGLIALALSVFWFAGRCSIVGFHYEVQRESFWRVLQAIPPPDFPGQPLAISDNLLVLPIRYYATPQLAARLVYPIDFPAIMRYRGEAASEVNLWVGRNSIYDLPILPLATLQRSTATYLILTSGHEWLIEDLDRHSYLFQPLFIDTHAVGTETMISPLSHGRPVFFRAAGDRSTFFGCLPVPFTTLENLPSP